MQLLGRFSVVLSVISGRVTPREAKKGGMLFVVVCLCLLLFVSLLVVVSITHLHHPLHSFITKTLICYFLYSWSQVLSLSISIIVIIIDLIKLCKIRSNYLLSIYTVVPVVQISNILHFIFRNSCYLFYTLGPEIENFS